MQHLIQISVNDSQNIYLLKNRQHIPLKKSHFIIVPPCGHKKRRKKQFKMAYVRVKQKFKSNFLAQNGWETVQSLHQIYVLWIILGVGWNVTGRQNLLLNKFRHDNIRFITLFYYCRIIYFRKKNFLPVRIMHVRVGTNIVRVRIGTILSYKIQYFSLQVQ